MKSNMPGEGALDIRYDSGYEYWTHVRDYGNAVVQEYWTKDAAETEDVELVIYVD